MCLLTTVCSAPRRGEEVVRFPGTGLELLMVVSQHVGPLEEHTFSHVAGLIQVARKGKQGWIHSCSHLPSFPSSLPIFPSILPETLTCQLLLRALEDCIK